MRPLRTLKYVPGMPVLVSSILSAVGQLGHVLGVLSFFLVIFGILGVGLFSGSLHYRCTAVVNVSSAGAAAASVTALRHSPLASPIDASASAVPRHLLVAHNSAHAFTQARAAAGMSATSMPSERGRQQVGRVLKGGGGNDDDNGASVGQFCNPSYSHSCEATGEATRGACVYFRESTAVANFDSVVNAIMVIAQIVTFDAWTTTMYTLMLAFSPWVWVYFLACALLGGFFIVNLFLAVVFDEFMRSKALEAAKEELVSAQRAVLTRSAEQPRQEGAGEHAAALLVGCRLTPIATPTRELGMQTHSSSVTHSFQRLQDEEDEEVDTPKARDSLPRAKVGSGGLPWLRPIVTSRLFLRVTLALLIANVVVMCMPYAEVSGTSVARSRYDRVPLTSFSHRLPLDSPTCCAGSQMTEADRYWVHLSANALAMLFVVEVAVRIIGVGSSDFFTDGWNQLDFTLALTTALDLSVNVAMSAGFGLQLNVTAFRALRLLRVIRLLRLVQYWKGVAKIFASLMGARGRILNISILLLVFMTCFALVGMQLFGGSCDAETGSRLHFDYFYPALITVLIVFSGGWVDAYEACLPSGTAQARIYFLSALLLGFFVILNLFVSIILESLAEYEEEEEEEEDATASSSEPPSRGEATEELMTDRTGAPPPRMRQKKREDEEDDVGRLHPVRAFCRASIHHRATEPTLVLLIAASSVALALDAPDLDKDSRLAAALHVSDYVFTLLFTLEAIFRFCAFDAFDPTHGYLTSSFNLLDLSIVVISIISLCPEMDEFSILRLLRILRPLRLLGKVPGMRLIFLFLTTSALDVLNVVGVVLFCHTLFAVIGMELFMGAFGACTDESIPTRELCVAVLPPLRRFLLSGRSLKGGGGSGGGEEDGVVKWSNPNFGSFDSFGSSMLLLFIGATGDGWEEHMFAGMDSQGPGVTEQRNDFSPMAVYFVMWLVIGSFTMMNLFVGSVVDNFTKIKAEEEGSATMTQEQRQWVRTMQEASTRKQDMQSDALPPTPPSNPTRRACFALVNSTTFDMGMTLTILVNVLLMTVDYHGIEEDVAVHRFYVTAMTSFTIVYYIECTLKLLGLGVRGYFSSNWNRFDFSLVCVSLLDQFAAELLTAILPVPPMLLRVVRIARVMRILRLLKRFKTLRDIIKTTLLSFPSFVNVGSLLGLVTFMYAILGVELFMHVGSGDELNQQRNFRVWSPGLDPSNLARLLHLLLTQRLWHRTEPLSPQATLAPLVSSSSSVCQATAGRLS